MSVDDDKLDFDYCELRLSIDVGARFGEPSEYILKYSGSIVSGYEFSTSVGEIAMYVVDLARAEEDDVSPLQVLDSYDSSVAHFCELLSETDIFHVEVESIVDSEIGRVLLLDRMTIAPEFRGQGLGRKALEVACDHLGKGTGCVLAALKAYPLQWEGKGRDRSAAFRKDQSKLVDYYTASGFQAVGGEGLMVRPL